MAGRFQEENLYKRVLKRIMTGFRESRSTLWLTARATPGLIVARGTLKRGRLTLAALELLDQEAC